IVLKSPGYSMVRGGPLAARKIGATAVLPKIGQPVWMFDERKRRQTQASTAFNTDAPVAALAVSSRMMRREPRSATLRKYGLRTPSAPTLEKVPPPFSFGTNDHGCAAGV